MIKKCRLQILSHSYSDSTASPRGTETALEVFQKILPPFCGLERSLLVISFWLPCYPATPQNAVTKWPKSQHLHGVLKVRPSSPSFLFSGNCLCIPELTYLCLEKPVPGAGMAQCSWCGHSDLCLCKWFHTSSIKWSSGVLLRIIFRIKHVHICTYMYISKCRWLYYFSYQWTKYMK